MRNRWVVAVAGTLSMMCLGAVYSWSIFTQPLAAAFGWSTTTTTWAFAWAIFSLGVGAVIGGRWQDRAGPRRVAVTGVVLWGLGNVLAGLGTARFGPWWLYLTYGVLGGLGNGIGYVAPVATVTKWFPGRRGLGSGLVVMGFGLGAFAYNNVVKALPSFVEASRYAAAVLAARAAGGAPASAGEADLLAYHAAAILRLFVLSGLVFALVGGLSAALVRDPPSSPARHDAPADPAGGARSYTPAEMLRTPQFYGLWLMLFVNVTAGILVIANAVPIMRELTGAAPAAAVAAYGLVAVCNGLGRLLWGAVSDRIGRNLAYVLVYGIQVVVFLVLGHLHGLTAVAALFAVVLLCYGGGFGTMPSFTADYFGTRWLGVNYGFILLAWGAAGLVGPIFAAWVKDRTGSFSGALGWVAWLLLGATILPIALRRPRGTRAGG
jgi:OFA family oxalate/formate antiporter-like MFS transporter